MKKSSLRLHRVTFEVRADAANYQNIHHYIPCLFPGSFLYRFPHIKSDSLKAALFACVLGILHLYPLRCVHFPGQCKIIPRRIPRASPRRPLPLSQSCQRPVGRNRFRPSVMIIISYSLSLILSIPKILREQTSVPHCFAGFGHVMIHVYPNRSFTREPQPPSSGSGCGRNGERTVPFSANTERACNASSSESI